ncbi:hypothetical protein ANCCAN_21898 [Ancylostoma caninum]|uniref:C-type lectin domain-containing protein n=1 Tax=Ancylostoma caninum TaxID=29170 RepID=A0A368FJR7_ANCCA|nr:hypothetical protein ANCCAN_21898 [Ancylostoma caninum]
MYSLLAFLAVVAVVASSSCEPGWRYFPVTNSCYKLIDEELPWTVAEFKCLFQGAHHVSVDSAAENQFVRGTYRFHMFVDSSCLIEKCQLT